MATYGDLIVLIPSHSLEDFPTETSEKDACSLLNAFAVVWHPLLLANAGVIPSWHRADEPPETLENQLIIVPTACDDWIPSGWVDHARMAGATVVAGISDRDEMANAAVEPLDLENNLDKSLVADFFALGTCFLQMELLTRQMHHFSNLDEVHLQREAVSAAEAAIANDTPAAETYLRSCFEILTEARERFYPVDCYLIDLCLLIPRLGDAHLEHAIAHQKPLNILVTPTDLREITSEKPELSATLREEWNKGTLDFVGGELDEGPSPLLPVESLLWQFRNGLQVFEDLLGRTPKTWGRRRFGLSALMPQILSKFGFHSALHVALDDGIYPDAEQSKIRWEGCDGTVLDAITRIPLAADSATSFVRFPTRMAESMEEDQVAAIIFARWPEVKSPWLDDFRRIFKYSPSLGRFVTFDDFFDQTDDPGRLSTFDSREYLTPFLVQAVARQEANPISRFTNHLVRRHQLDAALWYRNAGLVLSGKTGDMESDSAAERLIEQAGPEGTAEQMEAAESLLAEFVPESAGRLADVIMHAAEANSGVLLLNSLSFPRTVCVEVPQLQSAPEVAGPIKAVQFDESHKTVTVAMPASGYLWIPNTPNAANVSHRTDQLTAEDNVLRNEYFEVHINEETGGISKIKEYGRKPNRLSQQLMFRFPRKRTITTGPGDAIRETKTYYSEMRCHRLEITCDGPSLGEIVTEGEIIDQKDQSKLAGFRQTARLWRRRPIVDVKIELEIERMPEGDPWSNFYATRFAWNDSTASLTRSVQHGAQSFQGERFESLHYLEIASNDQRTTILNSGLPFHRITGPRMVDTILVTAGETKRSFRFSVAVDANYPMQAAVDVLTPVAVVPTEVGPPKPGVSGWFFHVDAKNVQISRILGVSNSSSAAELEPWEEHDRSASGSGSENGFAVRLIETEGRYRHVRLRCFKTPGRARQRDFRGRFMAELTIEDDCVLVEMTAYEIADIELWFDADETT